MRLILLCLTAVLVAACAPREILFPAIGLDVPRLDDLPADFQPPVSAETGQPMPGFGGTGGGVTQTPVIFVHGNTVSAGFWLPARKHFLDSGYTGDELWAFSYGWNSVRYFDSADGSALSLERIVNRVTNYLSEQTGQTISQVDVIGHSLGVTLTRQWLKQANAYHRVRHFIGVAGANDGVWTAWKDTRGQQRAVSWELYPNSIWLQQLNRGNETPGPTRYMMLYDGTGWGDVLFPTPLEDSGALDGANNVAFNRENDTLFGHLELPREPETMDVMIDWMRSSRQPDFDAKPPRIRRTGPLLTVDQPDSELRCTDDGVMPDATTPANEQVMMEPGAVYSCYALNPATHLPGRIERFVYAGKNAPTSEPPNLTIEPAGGVFEHPVDVRLTTDDPDAFIVYTTAGVPVGTGSPLYTDPVHITAPVSFTAMAVSPTGGASEPVTVEFDISLELVEARHSLQRQFDPSAPVEYDGNRKKGR